MQWAVPAGDFYRDAIRLLDEAKLPFLVGGAFALRVYTGIARDTKDFDLMVQQRDIDRALEVFQKAGYRAELAFPHWLAKVHHDESFIDVIFNSGNGICRVDQTWFDAAVRADLFGLNVLLCPPEEIVWQKCYVMERERFDGADIAHLIRNRGATMDWDRLVGRFGADWRVLLAHLLLFEFIYPSRGNVIPRRIMKDLLDRYAREAGAEVLAQNICYGTLLSRSQYLHDIEYEGWLDGRSAGKGAMTSDQIEIWTEAIAPRRE